MDFIKNLLPPMPNIKFPKMKKLRQWSSQSLDRTNDRTVSEPSRRNSSAKISSLNKIQYISTISSVHMVSTMDRPMDREPLGLAALKRDRAYERQLAKRNSVLLNVPMHHHFFSASEMVHEKFSPCKRGSTSSVAPESLPPYEHREFIQIDFNRVTHIDQHHLKDLEQSLEKAKHRNLEIVKTWPVEGSGSNTLPAIKPPPRRKKKLRPPPPPPVSQMETPRRDFQLDSSMTPPKFPRRRRSSQTSGDSLQSSLQGPTPPLKNINDLQRYQFMRSIVSTPDSMTSHDTLPVETPINKASKMRHSKSQDSLDAVTVKKLKPAPPPPPPKKIGKSGSMGDILEDMPLRANSFDKKSQVYKMRLSKSEDSLDSLDYPTANKVAPSPLRMDGTEKYMQQFREMYDEPKAGCNQIPEAKFPDLRVSSPELNGHEEVKIKRQSGWKKDPTLLATTSLESIAELSPSRDREDSIDIFKRSKGMENLFEEFDSIFSSPAHVVQVLPSTDCTNLDNIGQSRDHEQRPITVTEDLELLKKQQTHRRKSSITVQDFEKDAKLPRCKSIASPSHSLSIKMARVENIDGYEVITALSPQLDDTMLCRSMETIHQSSVEPQVNVTGHRPKLQQAQSVTNLSATDTSGLSNRKKAVFRSSQSVPAPTPPPPPPLEPKVTVTVPIRAVPRSPPPPKFDNPIDCRSNLNEEIIQFYENRQKLLKKVVINAKPPPPQSATAASAVALLPVQQSIGRLRKKHVPTPPVIMVSDNNCTTAASDRNGNVPDPEEFRKQLMADLSSRREVPTMDSSSISECYYFNNNNVNVVDNRFLTAESCNNNNSLRNQRGGKKAPGVGGGGSNQRRLNMASVEVEFSV